MLSSATAITKAYVPSQIEQLRKEAEEAKKTLNYELAFLLIDQADSLEREEQEFK